MGLLNRIFGSDESQQEQQNAQNAQMPRTTVTPVQPGQTQTTTRPGDGQGPASEDDMAVARYRYMLRTAPPETLEQAHAEAFQKLTPEQRRLALQQLAEADPEARNASDDPQTLARLATRAEVRQPGFLERTFGGAGMGGGMMGGGGIGMGGLIAGSLLSSVAGTFIGSAIAHSFFDNPMHANGFAQSGLAPAGSGDTTINNYYGDNAGGAGTDATGAAGDTNAAGEAATAGTTAGDTNVADTSTFASNDFDSSNLIDTSTADLGTGLDDLGGDFGGDF